MSSFPPPPPPPGPLPRPPLGTALPTDRWGTIARLIVIGAWVCPALMILLKFVSMGWGTIGLLLISPVWGALAVVVALILAKQLSPASMWLSDDRRLPRWLLWSGALWDLSWIVFGIGLPDGGDEDTTYNVLTRIARDRDPTDSHDSLLEAGFWMAVAALAVWLVTTIVLVIAAIIAKRRRPPAIWTPTR